MPFVKGQVPNPVGRKKGTQNKINGKTREIFQMIVEANHEQIAEDIKVLEPKDRVKVLLEMAQYFVPKMSVAQVEANVQNETRISLYNQLDQMCKVDEGYNSAIEDSTNSSGILAETSDIA